MGIAKIFLKLSYDDEGGEDVLWYTRSVSPQTAITDEKIPTLTIRLITLALLVTLLVMHVRSLRVFRWEQSVSGGVLVTYVVAVFGLVLCLGADRCQGKALPVYLCSTGAVLLAANGAVIYCRWRSANELTRAVAELLFVLGVPLRRQVILKASLSAAAALFLAIDLGFIVYNAYINSQKNEKSNIR